MGLGGGPEGPSEGDPKGTKKGAEGPQEGGPQGPLPTEGARKRGAKRPEFLVYVYFPYGIKLYKTIPRMDSRTASLGDIFLHFLHNTYLFFQASIVYIIIF